MALHRSARKRQVARLVPPKRQYRTLAEFMRATGIRQSQIAKLAGTTQATISRIARGDLIPRPALAARIAAVAHVPVESFAGEVYARRLKAQRLAVNE
jgi:transcriptional regulator with XRE-family HTH domain